MTHLPWTAHWTRRGSRRRGEAPVGAVIMDGTRSSPPNAIRMRQLNDPTAHAEMLAIRAALDARGTGRLDGCDLYVTLEPCAMCAGAIAHARVRRVVYGAEDLKAGAVDHGIRLFESPSCNHAPEIVSAAVHAPRHADGVLCERCVAGLRATLDLAIQLPLEAVLLLVGDPRISRIRQNSSAPNALRCGRM